jgi:DNA-binding response OmpR family regulator
MAATQSRNILLVEDDTDFRQTLAQQLRLHEEFEVEEAGTGEAAILGSEKTNYNAILLDVNVPDMDGRDVCHVLRRKGYSCAGYHADWP